MPSILNDIAISVPILTAAYYPTFVRCKGMKLRSASSFNFIEGFFQDLRYGLRTPRNSPGFMIVAVVTLALGIGAATSVLSRASALFAPNGDTQLLSPQSLTYSFPFNGRGRVRSSKDLLTPS